jgi:SAM-dependent methyltransferase
VNVVVIGFFVCILIFFGNWVYRTYSDRQLRLKKLDELALLKQKTDKPVLNISCGNTDYGDVNADVSPHPDTPGFVLYEPNKPLPFKDKEFGIVFSCHTIEHTDDPYAFERELRRVGDHVILLFPHYMDMSAWTMFHRWVYVEGKWVKNPMFMKWVEDWVDRMNWWREPKNMKERAIKLGLSKRTM